MADQHRGRRTDALLVGHKDAAEHRLPLLDRMYKEYERGTAPRNLEQLAEVYRSTDASRS